MITTIADRAIVYLSHIITAVAAILMPTSLAILSNNLAILVQVFNILQFTLVIGKNTVEYRHSYL